MSACDITKYTSTYGPTFTMNRDFTSLARDSSLDPCVAHTPLPPHRTAPPSQAFITAPSLKPPSCLKRKEPGGKKKNYTDPNL